MHLHHQLAKVTVLKMHACLQRAPSKGASFTRAEASPFCNNTQCIIMWWSGAACSSV